MAYKFEVKWSYRSMTGNYDGTKQIPSNYSDEEIIRNRARREIAHDMCFAPSMVEIKEIKRIY